MKIKDYFIAAKQLLNAAKKDKDVNLVNYRDLCDRINNEVEKRANATDDIIDALNKSKKK